MKMKTPARITIDHFERKDDKMKLRKYICALTASVMLVCMAGCGGSESSTGSSGDSSSDESSIEKVVRDITEESVGDLDYSDYIPESGVPEDFSFFIEAEDCKLTDDGMEVLSDDAMGEFSGDGYVGGFSSKGSLAFAFASEYDGRYDVVIKAARDDSAAAVVYKLDVDNGAQRQSFNISDSYEFTEIVVKDVSLAQGDHVIQIIDNAGSLYVDSIEIVAAGEMDLSMYDVSHKLSNPNANDTTQRLYNFLVDIYGKYTLTGQYSDSNNYPMEDYLMYTQDRAFKEITKKCGDLPAILGLDLIEYSPSRVANGSDDGGKLLMAAQVWDEANGIVTIAWHWNAPEPYLNISDDQPWYRGFYTEATSFDLAAALDGSDPEGYDYLIRDIDAIAAELQKLEDLDIPVLWRPLHEAGGDYRYNNTWFWWGASGAEAYKELWNLMYDRLTNYWGLDNLIWVWNAQRTDWYPGDETVDIIGYDFYADAFDYSSQDEIFEYIRQSTSTNKMIALSENGVVFDVDEAFEKGSRWSWFATWSGDYSVHDAVLSEQYTELDMWQKTYGSERALTLSELPDWHAYPLAYED